MINQNLRQEIEDTVESLMMERFNERPDFPPSETAQRIVDAVLKWMETPFEFKFNIGDTVRDSYTRERKYEIIERENRDGWAFYVVRHKSTNVYYPNIQEVMLVAE